MMRFVSAFNTNIGTQKQTNQDALLLLQADLGAGDEALLAVICDGVGGMERGEQASSSVTRALRSWFYERIEQMAQISSPGEQIFTEWENLIQHLHQRLKCLSEEQGFRWGTTVEVLLLLHGRYYICHVGDCRVYQLKEALCQLTEDHTLVEQEIRAGRLTPEQARTDSRQSLLLQCVGAGKKVEPDFLTGEISPGQIFLICCDGFRRKVNEADMLRLGLRAGSSESKMRQSLEKITQVCMRRGETDNITSILVMVSEKQQNGVFSNLFQAWKKEKDGKMTIKKDILEEHAKGKQRIF